MPSPLPFGTAFAFLRATRWCRWEDPVGGRSLGRAARVQPAALWMSRWVPVGAPAQLLRETAGSGCPQSPPVPSLRDGSARDLGRVSWSTGPGG